MSMHSDNETASELTTKTFIDAMIRIGLIAFLAILCFRVFSPFVAILLGGLILHQGWALAGALLLATTVGGLVGSLFDSLLGASVQAIYWCDACQKETERRIHRCGTQTRLLRGWRWLGNDAVNFFASIAGALVAMGIGWLLF